MQGGTFFILHPLMSSLSLVWIVCREVGLLQAFYLREGTVDLAGTTIHLHAYGTPVVKNRAAYSGVSLRVFERCGVYLNVEMIQMYIQMNVQLSDQTLEHSIERSNKRSNKRSIERSNKRSLYRTFN